MSSYCKYEELYSEVCWDSCSMTRLLCESAQQECCQLRETDDSAGNNQFR